MRRRSSSLMIVGFLARLGAVIDAAGSLHDKLTVRGRERGESGEVAVRGFMGGRARMRCMSRRGGPVGTLVRLGQASGNNVQITAGERA